MRWQHERPPRAARSRTPTCGMWCGGATDAWYVVWGNSGGGGAAVESGGHVVAKGRRRRCVGGGVEEQLVPGGAGHNTKRPCRATTPCVWRWVVLVRRITGRHACRGQRRCPPSSPPRLCIGGGRRGRGAPRVARPATAGAGARTHPLPPPLGQSSGGARARRCGSRRRRTAPPPPHKRRRDVETLPVGAREELCHHADTLMGPDLEGADRCPPFLSSQRPDLLGADARQSGGIFQRSLWVPSGAMYVFACRHRRRRCTPWLLLSYARLSPPSRS